MALQYEFADPSSFRSPRQRVAEMCHRDSSSQAVNTGPKDKISWMGRTTDDEQCLAFGLKFDDEWRCDVLRLVKKAQEDWSAYRAQRQAYRAAQESAYVPALAPYGVEKAYGVRSPCNELASSVARVNQRAREALDGFLASHTHASRMQAVQRRAEEAQKRFWLARDWPDTVPPLSAGGSTDDDASPATDGFLVGSLPFSEASYDGDVALLVAPAGHDDDDYTARAGTPSVVPSSWPRPVMRLWMPQPVRPRDIPRAAVLEEQLSECRAETLTL